MLDKKQLDLIKDEEHLKLLVIFHIIMGIITIVLSILFVVELYFLNNILNNPQFYYNFPHSENIILPPPELFRVISAIAITMIIVHCLTGLATLVSSQFIKKRKHRMFSVVIACINCIIFPLGTVLGIFTIIVLDRNSVIELYNNSYSKHNIQAE